MQIETNGRVLKSSWLRFLIGLSLMTFFGCARVHPVAESPSRDLKTICEVNGIAWDLDSVTQVVTLRKDGTRAKALIGSDVVILGNEKIVLSVPLRKAQGTVLVPEDFNRKIISAMGGTRATSTQKTREIVVDAGHGGKDPGALGVSGAKEKNITFDIAKRLRSNLEKMGLKVVMTRNRDEFVSLERRTEIATAARADLFVSIHANSSKARSVKGMEIYYLRDLNSTEKKDVQVKANQKTLFRNLSMEHNSPVLEGILSDMLYNYKRRESQKFAGYVHRKCISLTDAQDRGSKSAGFFVLRNTLIPSILVEVGFLTNPQEERKLKSTAYRQKLADSLAKSILDYVHEE